MANFHINDLDRDFTDKPHVLSLSGGRSSAMLLLLLLERGVFNPSRGDCVVFTNTSAEHPSTYDFIGEIIERFGKDIPIFMLEFCTFERKRKKGGGFMKDGSYRLVKPYPCEQMGIDDWGYHWRGEVYEELLSWRRMVPNHFTRVCTAILKVQTYRLFLKDYFSGKPSVSELGCGDSQITMDDLYTTYKKSGGRMKRVDFASRAEYVLKCHPRIPSQKFSKFSNFDFSKGINNPYLLNQSEIKFGENEDEVCFVNYLGIRSDEGNRVKNIQRSYNQPVFKKGVSNENHKGTFVELPLVDEGVGREAVNDFWKRQPFNLQLPETGELSNCTYCFLKGISKLKNAQDFLKRDVEVGEGYLENTPCDVNWWVKMEKKYHTISHKKDKVIGFYGLADDFSYADLRDGRKLDSFPLDEDQPCSCTD